MWLFKHLLLNDKEQRNFWPRKGSSGRYTQRMKCYKKEKKGTWCLVCGFIFPCLWTVKIYRTRLCGDVAGTGQKSLLELLLYYIVYVLFSTVHACNIVGSHCIFIEWKKGGKNNLHTLDIVQPSSVIVNLMSFALYVAILLCSSG